MGIDIDVNTGLLSVPHDKLKCIYDLCVQWAFKAKASKKQLQSLAGKLLYIHRCVKPARLFINRILTKIRDAPDKGFVKLDDEFYKDIRWFIAFIKRFNGAVFFNKSVVQHVNVYLDASLAGLGGVVIIWCTLVLLLVVNFHRLLYTWKCTIFS